MHYCVAEDNYHFRNYINEKEHFVPFYCVFLDSFSSSVLHHLV